MVWDKVNNVLVPVVDYKVKNTGDENESSDSDDYEISLDEKEDYEIKRQMQTKFIQRRNKKVKENFIDFVA